MGTIIGCIIGGLFGFLFAIFGYRKNKKKQEQERKENAENFRKEKEVYANKERNENLKKSLLANLNYIKSSSFLNKKEDIIEHLNASIPRELREAAEKLEMGDLEQVRDTLAEYIILRDEIDEYFTEDKKFISEYALQISEVESQLLKLKAERNEKQDNALYEFTGKLEKRIPEHMREKVTSCLNFGSVKDTRESIAWYIREKDNNPRESHSLRNFPLTEKEIYELNQAWASVVEINPRQKTFSCRISIPPEVLQKQNEERWEATKKSIKEAKEATKNWTQKDFWENVRKHEEQMQPRTKL